MEFKALPMEHKAHKAYKAYKEEEFKVTTDPKATKDQEEFKASKV